MFRKKDIHPGKLSDEALLKEIINGNAAMFEEIYQRYSKRMLYYFYRMLGNNEHLAQDFLQDLCFKILDNPTLFNPKLKFSTWIFSVAHNMCKNEYRRREVRRIVSSTNNLDSYTLNESKENNSHESVNRIYSELNTLDESHRTAFLVKYREGFDIKEISEILNLPSGTVKSRLFYARKKIQEKVSIKAEPDN